MSFITCRNPRFSEMAPTGGASRSSRTPPATTTQRPASAQVDRSRRADGPDISMDPTCHLLAYNLDADLPPNDVEMGLTGIFRVFGNLRSVVAIPGAHPSTRHAPPLCHVSALLRSQLTLSLQWRWQEADRPWRLSRAWGRPRPPLRASRTSPSGDVRSALRLRATPPPLRPSTSTTGTCAPPLCVPQEDLAFPNMIAEHAPRPV